MVGGGVIGVTVSGEADADFRARLTATMGPTRWKLVETDE